MWYMEVEVLDIFCLEGIEGVFAWALKVFIFEKFLVIKIGVIRIICLTSLPEGEGYLEL